MTAADHIRELAEHLHYWTGTADVKLDIRKLIARELPDVTPRQIRKALQQTPRMGRPRNPRCPHCGRPMPTTRQQGATP